MKLLATLQSGFADAPGGSALIYRRGTTTKATCYTDFAGTLATTTHSLDGNGRCRRFVNELVDVKVLDADGTQVVETFTEGDQATTLEIIHPHVTGVDYTTGASGLNKPSTLQRDLTARYSSFGADDSKVLVGGVARNLKDVLLTAFIDVKGPTYGAKGDNATNDTEPVQAAITAANAAGGGTVVFPPGTYLVDSLTIPSNVSLLGCGSGKSIIRTTSTSEVLLVAAGAFMAYGIQFKTTGKGLLRYSATVTASSIFTNCAFSCTNAATVDVLDCSDGASIFGATFLGCDFVQSGAGGTKSIVVNGATVVGGSISFVSGYVADGPQLQFTGALIAYGGAGTGTLLPGGGTAFGNFNGCAFVCTAAGNFQLNLDSGVSETGSVTASGGGGGAVSYTSRGQYSLTLEHVATRFEGGTETSLTPDPFVSSYYAISTSGASFQWNSPSNTPPVGTILMLFYKNLTGGAITPTLGANYKGSAVSVGAGQGCGWLFRYTGSTLKWVQIGSVVAYNA